MFKVRQQLRTDTLGEYKTEAIVINMLDSDLYST